MLCSQLHASSAIRTQVGVVYDALPGSSAELMRITCFDTVIVLAGIRLGLLLTYQRTESSSTVLQMTS